MFHDRTKVRDLALLTLMLGTGIRVSECVGLDLEDVDMRNNGIKIHRKGGAEVVVYFGEEVREALLAYMVERQKITAEDGRSVSRRDISRVFNAETLTIGFAAGAIGIGITLLLILPLNAIIHHLSGLSGVAALPAGAAVILVAISMLLTFLAGLIPSRIAAKKDPVIALRSE